MRFLVAVSGPIAVGKSAVISDLESRFRIARISTRELIHSIREVPNQRGALQEAGESLDRETDGKWVAASLDDRVRNMDSELIVVLDSVRIAKQIEHLRKQFGDKVWHVHLTATSETLEKRYNKRIEQAKTNVHEFPSYQEARANATEANVETLAAIANVAIQTDQLDPGSIATLAVAKLGLFPTSISRLVDVVVGGQYGSEGKGNICDYLSREYGALVRVGGPNAGHKVKEPSLVYDYVQMPSGTKGNPDAKILIGAGATLDLTRVFKEIIDLDLRPPRLSIDPHAIVIEQSDRDLEHELGKSIGSTKKGVGIATARKIIGRGGESVLGSRVRLVKDVPELQPYMRLVTSELESLYLARTRIMLEGTQGTDLSIHHGLYPSVTSRETTASGCLADAGIPPARVDRVYMVTRTYPIRVGGNSGEMGIEIDFETVAARSGLPLQEIQQTEIGTISGKQRRIGEFSWERVRRAVQLNGASDIVLTFADYIHAANRNARNYNELSRDTKQFIEDLQTLTGVSVSIIAVGSSREYIIDRRTDRGT